MKALTDARMRRLAIWMAMLAIFGRERVGAGDNVWTGVSTREIAERAGIKPEATFVLALAYDYGWTTNVPIEYFLKEDSLFAFLHDGQPIPPEHGGPVRLIIPQLYAWKSAKWVKGVRFLDRDQAGFWEEGGYHMRGNPWVGGDGERFRW